MPFFNSLTEEICQIYVYGFSCGKVDELYLKEIIKRTYTVYRVQTNCKRERYMVFSKKRK